MILLQELEWVFGHTWSDGITDRWKDLQTWRLKKLSGFANTMDLLYFFQFNACQAHRVTFLDLLGDQNLKWPKMSIVDSNFTPWSKLFLIPTEKYIPGKSIFCSINMDKTRKYPLRGYILGVLTHTTAWDQHWWGDETLNWLLIIIPWLCHNRYFNECSSA